MAKTETDLSTRSYKYKIEQTPRGALITVCGDAIDEAADYARLRVKLETEGFRVAPEE